MPDELHRIDGLNWGWIGIAVLLPPCAALLAAWPLWRRRQAIFGNIVATCILFGSAFAFIMREYVQLDALTQQCLEAGTTCFPDPSAFTRFAIYACIALAQIFLVFSMSLVVEERIRGRDYSPEWR